MTRAIFAALAAFFVLIGSASLLHIDNNQAQANDVIGNAVVKVKLKGGHGSAVHIGNGWFLTAAHVSAEKQDILLISDDERRMDAEVLWYSRKYDIVLMRSDMAVQAVNLECRRPAFREVLEMRGNPINLEHISTWGRVAGQSHKLDSAWENVVPIDGAMAGGMSGGAAFDELGNLVGINVGAMVQPMGFSGSLVGISYIVPGDVICGLMGRE